MLSASYGICNAHVIAEHGYTKKATEVMDTYSFGVILLELITGRGAEQKKASSGPLDVVKWVRRKINISNGASQVLDPKISPNSHKEMVRALEIALQCTNVNPEKRPESMSEVLRMLQSIKSSTESSRGSS